MKNEWILYKQSYLKLVNSLKKLQTLLRFRKFVAWISYYEMYDRSIFEIATIIVNYEKEPLRSSSKEKIE